MDIANHRQARDSPRVDDGDGRRPVTLRISERDAGSSSRSDRQALVAQKCDEMLGEDLGNEDVRKVLLPLDDHESRIGEG